MRDLDTCKSSSGCVRVWTGWHGHTTMREPLLLILHIGYAWLIAGVALRSLALLYPKCRSEPHCTP